MKRTLSALALCFVALSLFAADEPAPKTVLRQVEAKTVCMVNEHAMGKDQIPVEVDGKTYYGCCEMCKKALATDASKRVATDPISGKEVDKASAIIGAAEDGHVFYFASLENLAKWNAEAGAKQ